MTLGIDISSDMVSFSYLQDGRIKTCFMKESVGFRTKDLYDDDNKLGALLMMVKNYAEQKLNHDVENVVLAIPEYCNYNQRKRIKRLTEQCGMSLLRMAGSNQLLSFALCDETYFDSVDLQKDEYANIICTMCSDYAELYAFTFGEGVIECLGSATINVGAITDGNEAKQLRMRISSEVKQFMMDLKLSEMLSPRTTLFLSGISCPGIVKECFAKEFKKAFGLEPLGVEGRTSRGALLLAMKLLGNPYVDEDLLLLCTQNKAINAALGENGEHIRIIDYYSTIPTVNTGELLVSTETTLNIYEGNYINRRYDKIIGSFEIPEFLEGHVINVTVNIGVDFSIIIRVEDDRGNIIIPDKKL